jgi:hypothetical protein
VHNGRHLPVITTPHSLELLHVTERGGEGEGKKERGRKRGKKGREERKEKRGRSESKNVRMLEAIKQESGKRESGK